MPLKKELSKEHLNNLIEMKKRLCGKMGKFQHENHFWLMLHFDYKGDPCNKSKAVNTIFLKAVPTKYGFSIYPKKENGPNLKIQHDELLAKGIGKSERKTIRSPRDPKVVRVKRDQ